ncbi:MAG TPA: hypothetical protein PLI18_08725 [Pirellulaceae bacterium]|nr:hypothetical protein [Pirellulaceae bacterium]
MTAGSQRFAWQGKKPAGPTNAERFGALVLFGLLIVGLAVVFGWRMLLPPAPPRSIAVVWFFGSDDLTVPALPRRARDRERLIEVFRERVDPSATADDSGKESFERRVLDPSLRPEDGLIVYLSGQGTVVDDRPMLVGDGFDPFGGERGRASGRLDLVELLGTVARSSAGTKFVLIDAGDRLADPAFWPPAPDSLDRIGRADFAPRLMASVDAIGDPTLTVVVSHDVDQLARFDPTGGSLFAQAIETTLLPSDDPDAAGGVAIDSRQLAERIASMTAARLPETRSQRPVSNAARATAGELPLIPRRPPSASDAAMAGDSPAPAAADPAAPPAAALDRVALAGQVNERLLQLGVASEPLGLVDEIDRLRITAESRSGAFVSPIDYAPHWWRVWNVDRRRAFGEQPDARRLNRVAQTLRDLASGAGDDAASSASIGTEYPWEREVLTRRGSRQSELERFVARPTTRPLERRSIEALAAIDDLRYRARDHVELTDRLDERLPITFRGALDDLLGKLADAPRWDSAERTSVEAIEAQRDELLRLESTWRDELIAWSVAIGRKSAELPDRWRIARDEVALILSAAPQVVSLPAEMTLPAGRIDRVDLLARLFGLPVADPAAGVPGDAELAEGYSFERVHDSLRLASDAGICGRVDAYDLALPALEPRAWTHFMDVPRDAEDSWLARLSRPIPQAKIDARLVLVDEGRPFVGTPIVLPVEPYPMWESEFVVQLDGRDRGSAMLSVTRFPTEQARGEWSQDDGATWRSLPLPGVPERIELVRGTNRFRLRGRALIYRDAPEGATFDPALELRIEPRIDDAGELSPLTLTARAALPERPIVGWSLADPDLARAFAASPDLSVPSSVDQTAPRRIVEVRTELGLLPEVPSTLQGNWTRSFADGLTLELFALSPPTVADANRIAWGRHDAGDAATAEMFETWRRWMLSDRSGPRPRGLVGVARATAAPGAPGDLLAPVWQPFDAAPTPAAPPDPNAAPAPPISADLGLAVLVTDASRRQAWLIWHQLRLLRPDEFLVVRGLPSDATTPATLLVEFDRQQVVGWSKPIGFDLSWERSDPALPPIPLAAPGEQARLPYVDDGREFAFLQVGAWCRAFSIDRELRARDPAPTTLSLDLLPGEPMEPVDIADLVDGRRLVYTRRDRLVLELLADRPAEDDFRGDEIVVEVDGTDEKLLFRRTARAQSATVALSPEGALTMTIAAAAHERMRRLLDPDGERTFRARTGGVEQLLTVRHDGRPPELRTDGIRLSEGGKRLRGNTVTIGSKLTLDVWVRDAGVGLDDKSVKGAIGDAVTDLLPEPDVENGYRLFRGVIDSKDWKRGNVSLAITCADRLGNTLAAEPLELLARPPAETGVTPIDLPPMPVPADVILTLPLTLNGRPFAWSRVDSLEVDGKPFPFEAMGDAPPQIRLPMVQPGAAVVLVVKGRTQVNRDVVVGTVRWTLPADNVRKEVSATLPAVPLRPE